MVYKKTGIDSNNHNEVIQPTKSVSVEHSSSNYNNSKTSNQRSTKKDNIIINVTQPKSDQPKIANIISAIAAFISLCLGIITYSLFLKSSAQTQAALRADTIAYNSYKSSDSINKVNATLNKQTFDETKSYNRLNFIDAAKKNKRDSMSFAAQIASLKETQKEFDIENRPLIQIGDIRYDTLMAGKRIRIKFNFLNMGKQPARCLDNKIIIMFTDKDNFNDFNGIKWQHQNFNSYLVSPATLEDEINTIDTVSELLYKTIKDGRVKAYLMGMFKFENIVTHVKNQYQYNYRITFSNKGIDIQGMKDTTFNIKN